MNNNDILMRVSIENGLTLVVDKDDRGDVVVLEGLDGFARDDQCIFKGCNNDETRSLLESWLKGTLRCDRDVEFQLSRLLSERGTLVRDLANGIIQEENWSGFNCKQFFLSHVRNMDDFEFAFPRYLRTMPEDFRDGLFVAAMYEKTQKVDMVLIDAFSRWYTSGNWSPDGTGEDGWLEYFLKRWMQVYPISMLEVPLKAYFDVCV